MWRRCTGKSNPLAVKFYADRGRTVDPVFQSFDRFFEEVGRAPGPEYILDRIDNEKGYCVGNLRWANMHTQHRNKRSNVKIRYRGKKYLLCDFAEFMGIDQRLSRMRIFVCRWPLSKAIKKKDFRKEQSPSWYLYCYEYNSNWLAPKD